MPYLRDCLQSIFSIDEVEWELVVVDDGSTDHTNAYLSTLDDTRIKIVTLEKNGGIAAAANKGLQHCSADLIARIDSDDLLLPGRLKAQVEYFKNHPEVGVVATQAELTETDFAQDGYQFYVGWSNALKTNQEMYAHRFRDSPIINPSVAFRKALVQKYGGYKLNVPEDYEFWLRLWSEGVIMHKLPIQGVVWRDHSKRLTRNHSDYSSSSFDEVKLEYIHKEWTQKMDNRPVYIWGKSKNARDWHERLSSVGIEVAGFVDFNSGTWRNLPVLSNSEALALDVFFFITLRDRKGTALLQKALLERGRKASDDYYFL